MGKIKHTKAAWMAAASFFICLDLLLGWFTPQMK
jgi:hypothetical protein